MADGTMICGGALHKFSFIVYTFLLYTRDLSSVRDVSTAHRVQSAALSRVEAIFHLSAAVGESYFLTKHHRLCDGEEVEGAHIHAKRREIWCQARNGATFVYVYVLENDDDDDFRVIDRNNRGIRLNGEGEQTFRIEKNIFCMKFDHWRTFV